MSEPENTRGSCSEGSQEPNRILQPEYDGSICVGFGMIVAPTVLIKIFTNFPKSSIASLTRVTTIIFYA